VKRVFLFIQAILSMADALITNLHLAAFNPTHASLRFRRYEPVMRAYRDAVKQSYRFYSYGDACGFVLHLQNEMHCSLERLSFWKNLVSQFSKSKPYSSLIYYLNM